MRENGAEADKKREELMKTERKEDRIGNALLKVALGCQVEEVTEEFAEVDGELRLTKRRKTRKDIPPDLKAVQMLLAGDEADYSVLSDEELETEKERLLALLKEKEGQRGRTEASGEQKAPPRKKPRGEIRRRKKEAEEGPQKQPDK